MEGLLLATPIRSVTEVFLAPIIIAFFLLGIVSTNKRFEDRIRLLFIMAISFSVALSILDSYVYYSALSLSNPYVRAACASIAYALRPVILMFIVLIARGKKLKNYGLYFIPCALVFIISIMSVFFKWPFWYDDNGEFIRTSFMALFPHIVAGLYTIFLLYSASKVRNGKSEFLVLMFLIIFMAICVVIESVVNYKGILDNAIIAGLMCYYLYLNIVATKKDSLTNLLDRKSFLIDTKSKDAKIHCIISVDLNDLKEINDTLGHVAGDNAIITVASCMLNHVLTDGLIYRTGGDEFIIVMYKEYDEDTLYGMMECIKNDVSSKGYSCAMGLKIKEANDSVNETLAKADKLMYEDKALMKGKNNIR